MWRNKVLWSEGLFLRPQHFQQQDRYFEHLVDRRAKAIASFGWGFEELTIDDSALAIGQLSLREAAGVLPDGTAFSVPLYDRPAPALTVGASLKDSLIYLAAVQERSGVPMASLDATEVQIPLRYVAESSEVPDYNVGFDESAPIQVGSLRLALVAQSELTGVFASMPVARVIERRPDGQVVLDRQFIPPFLATHASPNLRAYLGELRGLMRQRSDALATRMVQPGRGGVAEIADFLLLQAVNRYGALLEHLANVPRLHPERFYSICVTAAGDLAAFGSDRRLMKAFPAYDHDNLEPTFRPVIEQLRIALSMVLEQNAIQIPLQYRKFGVHVGVIADKGLLTTASFVLAVNAQMPSEALRLRFPAQVKIGPVEKIRDLVNLQLPGVSLRALPVVPRQIPFHAGFNYFELDTKHELWRMLDQAGGLALHVSGDFPGLELEFWAVRG